MADVADLAERLSATFAPFAAEVGGVASCIVVDGERSASVVGTSGWDDAPLDVTTRFQLGSITKGFTGILVAVLAERGVFGLDDEVAVHVPELGGTPVGCATVRQLATHTAGLPRRPASSAANPPDDPYRGVTRASLVADVAALAVDPPHPYAYSNVGYALLGYAMDAFGGWPHLLRTEVLDPLGLSAIELRPHQVADDVTVARALGRSGNPVPGWDVSGIPGAAGLVSDVVTLSRVVDVIASPDACPLASAVRTATTPHALGAPRADGHLAETGLGWRLLTVPGYGRIVSHNGHGRGNHAFVAVLPEAGAGVVAMANHHHDANRFDIAALRLLASVVRPA